MVVNSHIVEKYIFLALFLGACFYEVKRSHDANLVAKAENSVLQQDNIKIQQQRQAEDAAYQAKIDALLKQAGQVKTPAEVVKYIPQLLPNLPVPITVKPSEPTVPGQVAAPKEAVIPAADFLPLYQHEVTCQECTYKLAQAQNDAKSVEAENTNLKQQNGNLEKALKGGNWLQRLWHDSKLLAIGGGIALGVACATGHCPR